MGGLSLLKRLVASDARLKDVAHYLNSLSGVTQSNSLNESGEKNLSENCPVGDASRHLLDVDEEAVHQRDWNRSLGVEPARSSCSRMGRTILKQEQSIVINSTATLRLNLGPLVESGRTR